MQEKIAELMWARGERYEGSPDLHMNPMTVKVIAHAIAALFEGKVIWEGEGEIRHRILGLVSRKDFTRIRLPDEAGHVGKSRQCVRVVVEDIDESRT